MHVDGTFEVHRDRATVFAFFTNARDLVDCLDDPHTVEVPDPTHFTGTVTTGVAFIRGTFRMNGAYTETRSPERVSAKIHGAGLGSGVDAVITTDLLDAGGGSTTIRWTADFTFSGPIASVGERIIRGTVDKKAQGLFENARRRLEAGSA
jgi:uncharacterized protein